MQVASSNTTGRRISNGRTANGRAGNSNGNGVGNGGRNGIAAGSARTGSVRRARSKVAYSQSASEDLGLIAREQDPRARRASTRPNEKFRVLDQSYDELPPSQRKAGMTAREYRRRYQRQTRQRNPLLTGIIVALGAALLLAIGGLVVYISPAFSIKHIEVLGAERLSDSDLKELAAVPVGMTLLRVDTDAIAQRLQGNAWVENVQVKRSFPSTLTLQITERSIAAAVEIPPASAQEVTHYWLISSDGLWLCALNDGAWESVVNPVTTDPAPAAAGAVESSEDSGDVQANDEATDEATDAAAEQEGSESSTEVEVTAPTAEELASTVLPDAGTAQPSLSADAYISSEMIITLPLIKTISPALRPEAGRTVSDEGIINALDIIKGFSPEMLQMVEYIYAPDKVQTTLNLKNHVGVAFGAAEDVQAKEQVIQTLLAEHEGTITYINVRVADRATYRATD
ncbi:MAG: FtsQ-type POTRA domain-containing protein [Coriobacteriales bacterium]|jgi:cell division protein FtsQ|nr:FtsQ-type POTRA domain-containing protein [Coriobacteriales bacterium]